MAFDSLTLETRRDTEDNGTKPAADTKDNGTKPAVSLVNNGFKYPAIYQTV